MLRHAVTPVDGTAPLEISSELDAISFTAKKGHRACDENYTDDGGGVPNYWTPIHVMSRN